MKIQYIAVIFIVIILPISIVTSSYINSQIETIQLQNNYNTKLISATHDSMRAFQINTVNNNYSSISNSKIRDIEASVNTFYNSLSNTEQLSKEDLKSYVPALVFTMYDGYYIYSKYDNTYVNTDGTATNDGKPELNEDELKKEIYTNYGLKPYIYYSCRYKNGNKDFVVNYTLDNAITIYGNIGEGYKTYSGYFINPDLVIEDNYNPNNSISLMNSYIKIYDDNIEIKPEVLTEHLLFVDGNEKDYTYIVYNGQKIYREHDNEIVNDNEKYFWYQNYSKTYINDATTLEYTKKRDWNGQLHSTSALEYYHNAKEFSEMINSKLSEITQDDAVNEDGKRIGELPDRNTYFSVNTGEQKIFEASNTNDPLLSGSTFNENRVAVIRKSIETNLRAAIANYNEYSGNNYEFAMPILSEEDWAKLADNVSVTAFLQGIPIGNKYYNNYCVITNDDNKEVVKKENIYIITEKDENREYHLPGCTHLIDDNTISENDVNEAYSNLSFIRQTVRKSENDYIYFYPQKRVNKMITSCYYCIVNATSVYSPDEIISGKLITKDENWEDEEILMDDNKIRTLYLTALARERYDLYQVNMDSFN